MADYSDFSWRRTSASPAASRYDDVWFYDDNIGWGVNSNGLIVKTVDGGDNWLVQASLPGVYLRCIGFANDRIGWVGTTAGKSPDDRLYQTTDGGANWAQVKNLPNGAPKQICGLWVVDQNTVHACGSNLPDQPTAIITTTDGGKNWTAVDMKPQASSLIDIYFRDANNGWVTGGQDSVKCGGRTISKPDLLPVVLHTTDGGKTWINLISNPDVLHGVFPRGEWGWKIQAIAPSTIVISLQNYRDGAFLRSDDDGKTWSRMRINDRQRNSNLEGIGFLDGRRGWVGGWGDFKYEGGFTSVTSDGGLNWDCDNCVLFRINRFRFIGSPVRIGYAAGESIYKFTNKPLGAFSTERLSVQESGRNIGFAVPPGARSLLASVYEPDSGIHVRTLVDEHDPEPGNRNINWDLKNADGVPVPGGIYFVRVSVDMHSQTHTVYVNKS
jgi:photosystem II stability/assembly factor-like uncharacterized protein